MNIAIFVITLVAGTMFGVAVHKVGTESDNGSGWVGYSYQLYL